MSRRRPFSEALDALLTQYGDPEDMDDIVTALEEATERAREAAEGGTGFGRGHDVDEGEDD